MHQSAVRQKREEMLPRPVQEKVSCAVTPSYPGLCCPCRTARISTKRRGKASGVGETTASAR